jgi:hypothetical protein
MPQIDPIPIDNSRTTTETPPGTAAGTQARELHIGMVMIASGPEQ